MTVVARDPAESSRHVPPASRLRLALARHADEVEAAQRLRWQVFAGEMGARLSGPPGIDRDLFDPFCDHLLVRDEHNGEVVGTYRLLAPHQARRIGGYYSESEFDLTRLWHLRERMVEVGRSCVHPEYRNGAVIGMLWRGVAEYMGASRCEYLIGCASIGMHDGGRTAATIFRQLSGRNTCPPEYRVTPRCPLPLDAIPPADQVTLPPLVKGYLRLGAYVCGAPAWDPDFNTADLPVLLPVARVDPRHARRLGF